MQDFDLLWGEDVGPSELPRIARRVVAEVVGENPELSPVFCLWLIGGLGAGKTTFAGEFLRSLGLPENIPVTSPTYTYLNEYRIGEGAREHWYAHLDLYRIGNQFDPSELGIFDVRPFRGFLVEWPEMLKDPGYLAATHILSIEMASGGKSRIYTLKKAAFRL